MDQVLAQHADTLAASGADTLHAAATHEAGGSGIFAELLHHVQDSHELDFTPFFHVQLPRFHPFQIAGLSIDMSITKHVVFLWVAAVVLCIFAIAAARRNRKNLVPSGIGNLMEVFVVFMRDEVVLPNMGQKGVKYMPYLLTTFFYILVMNLMGLVPYGASSTGNISVTAALAIIAFFMIQAAAIKSQGLWHFLKHLTGGVHWALWPIMIPIEILGLFTKPFALCVRLFANMTGGHTVIVSIIGLIFIFKSYVIALGPAGFAVGLFFLELFVAFLQAYIFTMLTSLFMGLGMQSEGHGDSAH